MVSTVKNYQLLHPSPTMASKRAQNGINDQLLPPSPTMASKRAQNGINDQLLPPSPTMAIKRARYDPPSNTYNNELFRIVMVGKTGVGKSATGNNILGKEFFPSKFSAKSMTVDCSNAFGEVDGQKVKVIDTPGLFDTSIDEEKTRKDVGKSVAFASPGPHIFLVVIKLCRFTDEEKQTVQKIQEIFGEEANKYSMVLFTHGDLLEDKTIEEFLKESEALQELVDRCNGQCHVFNNKVEDRSQVKELLNKIRKITEKNGGSHYTNEMFQEAERELEEEKQRILEEREEEIRKQEEEIQKRLDKKNEEQLQKIKEDREKSERQIEACEREMEKEMRKKREKHQKQKAASKKEMEEGMRRLREEEERLREASKRSTEEERRRIQEEGERLREAHKREMEEEKRRLREEEDRRARKDAEENASWIDDFFSAAKTGVNAVEQGVNAMGKGVSAVGKGLRSWFFGR